MTRGKPNRGWPYTFTLPFEVARTLDVFLESEYLKASEYFRALVLKDLKEKGLIK